MSNIPLSERAKWVGASESAALLGVSPYCTRFELFHQKLGTIPPHNLDDQERVQAGQHLEPAIAEWASTRWHWPLRNVREYLTHPSVERMGASLDFEALDGLEPVEIKNVDSLVFRDQWEADGDTVIDAPAHILVQVQHQLACRPRAERGWIVACVGGNRLYRMEVPRHERMIARVEREVAEFWRDVLAGREPAPDFQADAETISLLYSRQGEAPVDLSGNERFAELCAEYLAAHEIETGAKKRKKAALAEIKTLMRDAPLAIGANGYRVKASAIQECTTVRAAHRRFSVTQKQE